MEKSVRKPRKVEDVEKRVERLENAEQQRRDDDAADDERMDEMVRRNVEQRGA